MSLAEKNCLACRGDVPPLDSAALAKLAPEVPAWSVVAGHHLTRDFAFPDFRTALDFVNKIGALAEQQGHHPDLTLAWGKVGVTVWTHKINGLTESDFILASKIDRALSADFPG